MMGKTQLYRIDNVVYLDRIRMPVQLYGVEGRVVFLEEYSTRRLKSDESYRKFMLDVGNGICVCGWWRGYSIVSGEIHTTDREVEVVRGSSTLSSVVTALALSRVSGEEIVKGLRARGVELKVKLTQNYLGGWNLTGVEDFDELYKLLVVV